MNKEFNGFAVEGDLVPYLELKQYDFFEELRLNFSIIYEVEEFQFYAVDRFASMPIYYVILDNKILKAASNIDDLLKYLNYNVSFDPIGYSTCDLYLNGSRSERTMFVEIKRIEPGCYIQVNKGISKKVCYWSFKSLVNTAKKDYDFDSAASELGKRIVLSLQTCLEKSEHCGLHLSGGIDSGAICSIISQLSSSSRYVYRLTERSTENKNVDSEGQHAQKILDKYPFLIPIVNLWEFDTDGLAKLQSQIRYNQYWFAHNCESAQYKIVSHAKSKDIQFILTGLGGNELASYGSEYQKSIFPITNDFMARLYWGFKFGFIKKLKFWSRVLLKNQSHKKLQIQSYNLTFKLSNMLKSNYKNWYRSKYLKKLKGVRNYGYSYFLPCTKAYRLECLDREYFTVRSDIWNNVGQEFNISYIHPLLHKDIVEFCATLPRKFYSKHSTRELFIQALRPYMPEDLLDDPIRTTRNVALFSAEEVKLKIYNCNEQVISLVDTFANDVFDFELMSKRLMTIYHDIDEANFEDSYNIAINDSLLYRTNDFILKGLYLNKYFN